MTAKTIQPATIVFIALVIFFSIIIVIGTIEVNQHLADQQEETEDPQPYDNPDRGYKWKWKCRINPVNDTHDVRACQYWTHYYKWTAHDRFSTELIPK